MIFAAHGFQVNAPERVVPGVAFQQFCIACGQKSGLQVCMSGELVLDKFSHDGNADLVPVRPQVDMPSGAFGLRGVHRLERFAQGGVQALGCLKGCFDAGIDSAVQMYFTGVEVAQETIFVLKFSDSCGHIFVTPLFLVL